MLPSTLPNPRTPSSMDAPPLRWGILGSGWIADQFVSALRAHTRQVVQAVGSRSAATAATSAARYGARTAHASYEALVADPDVDVVYVATPHNFHLPHSLLAIGAGKHVLIEKPVGLDAEEAREIEAAATRAGVFCMEAMWTLFLPKFDVIRQLLDDGVLGSVHTILADMGETFAPQHRIFDPRLAGGPLLDLGTYPVTLATWVLGAPDAVWAVGSPAPSGVNGQIAAVLGSPKTTAALHFSILGETPTVASISGSDAVIEIDRHFYRPGGFTLRDATGTAALRWQEAAVGHEGLHFEAAEVARRIAAGETGSPLSPMARTIETLEVMDRIRQSVGFDFTAAAAPTTAVPDGRPIVRSESEKGLETTS
ncbi:Gfo/Idh/MocA family oxidoreductase [Knoellia sp. S7-12]|uniref:Gfo/Idh/MocA family protein n=1 Tax=Knoellia sp. S7-12 TaxID=3126698 RepID=UPI0033685C38